MKDQPQTQRYLGRTPIRWIGSFLLALLGAALAYVIANGLEGIAQSSRTILTVMAVAMLIISIIFLIFSAVASIKTLLARRSENE